MATRALVGFITDKPELISTYNHYDGYPENLGEGLESHYSSPEKAREIASLGYISYMDPKTGEIEARHREPADRTPLSTDFDEAMMQVAEMGDSYGADYIYIYNVEISDWVHASLGRGIREAEEELSRKLIDLDGSIFDPSLDGVNEDYNTKWKKFLNEEEKPQVKVEDDGTKKWYLNGKIHREDGPAVEWVNGDKFWYLNHELHREDGPAIEYANGKKEWYLNGEIFTEEEFNEKTKSSINEENGKMPLSKVISQALFKLQDEPKYMIDAYKTSLANDIRLNGKEQYEDYSVEDFVEDYENYIADKMDM